MGQQKVLFVDDNRAFCQVALQMFKILGKDVQVVNSGFEAVQCAGEERYDMIFIDSMMPDMDGVETVTRIRKTEGHENIPVISISAVNDYEYINKLEEAGMTEYVGKPFSMSDLKRLFGQYFDNLPVRLWDRDAVLKNYEGDEDALKIIVTEFKGQIDTLVEQLLTATQARNEVEIRMAAHSIKGFLLMLEAKEITKLAHTIEEMGQSGDLHNVDDLSSQLKSLIRQLHTEIDEEVAV